MGIYIKNMEKPTSCDVCQFMRSCGKWTAKFVEHNGKNGKTWIPTYPIPEICPLIEIKTPHGRLIDADKQHKRLQKQVMALYSEKSDKYSYLMDVLYSIHGEPTIIEAEGE